MNYNLKLGSIKKMELRRCPRSPALLTKIQEMIKVVCVTSFNIPRAENHVPLGSESTIGLLQLWCANKHHWTSFGLGKSQWEWFFPQLSV